MVETMLPQSHPTVLDYVAETLPFARHATLIDPANQSPDIAANRAIIAIEAGSKLIMVGGSTNTPDEQVHNTVIAIQEAMELRIWGESQDASSIENIDWEIPVVLFPGGANALSPAADAITFMMLMNSENVDFLVGEQMRGAPYLSKTNVEAMPTGYIVCAPGGKVGEIGQAKLIPPDDISGVSAWSQCAQMFGFKLLYLEAGSGADTPVAAPLISAASEVEGLTLFVGGGINDGDAARRAVESGANWIVTGTLTENCPNLEDLHTKLSNLITAMNQSSS